MKRPRWTTISRCRAATPWRRKNRKGLQRFRPEGIRAGTDRPPSKRSGCIYTEEESKVGRIFAIMSGKGGVGKSTLAVALAQFYARHGKRVVLLDGDIGLRCADLMLGLQNQVIYDLGDLAEKDCTLEEALVSPPGLPEMKLLAAPQLLTASDLKRGRMGRIITELSDQTDILLLDAPAGVGRGLKNLLGAAAEPVIVATPDDVSVRDAERLCSILSQREEPRPVIVFNRVRKKLVRRGEMKSPGQLAAALDMPLMGVIPESPKIYRALLRNEGALQSGDGRVIRAIEVIAARLLGADAPMETYEKSAMLRFFTRGGEA